MGYFKKAVKGVSWVAAFRGVTRAMGFIRTAIIAHLITPAQFGIFSISSLVLTFLEIALESGINVVLIQKKERIDKYIDTAWVVSIFRGLIIALIVLLAAHPVSIFFNSLDSFQLILLISLVPIIRGFINPSIVHFRKDLKFQTEFWFRTIIFAADSGVAIIAVLITRSPIGIVIGLISGALTETILSFILIKPLPGLAFSAKKAKEIIKKGWYMSAYGIFNYFSGQGDDIVVGKLLSTGPLGLYQMAYKFSTLPLTEVTHVISRVTFPVYSKIAHDPKRLMKAYTKTLITTLLLVVPIGIALFLFAEPIVRIILGVNWLGAVGALRVLSLFGVVKAIIASTDPLFLALKKQNIVALVALIQFIILAIFIIPLTISQGIVGAGLASVISVILALPVISYQIKKHAYSRSPN